MDERFKSSVGGKTKTEIMRSLPRKEALDGKNNELSLNKNAQNFRQL
jgi:hypothetical protein